MSQANTQGAPPAARPFPAKVVKIVDSGRLAINRGAIDGIKVGQRFVIYGLDPEEIRDPDSGELLGQLETVRGTGRVTHVQSRLATIQSDRVPSPEREIVRRKSPFTIFGNTGGTEEHETIKPSSELLPFDDAELGDLAKPI